MQGLPSAPRQTSKGGEAALLCHSDTASLKTGTVFSSNSSVVEGVPRTSGRPPLSPRLPELAITPRPKRLLSTGRL